MPTARVLQRSFGGGELSPEMFGRTDDAKYQVGLATCRNFVIKPQGPAENRPGFAYVNTVKNSAQQARLISFTFSTTQTMVIEMGAGYFRFHTQGETLLYSAPAAWVTATAYAVGDLVAQGGTNYYCKTAHTSGVFATDLAAGDWYALPADGTYEIPNPFAEADLSDIHYVQSDDVLTLVHPNYPPQELQRYGATNWQLAATVFGPSQTAPTGVTAAATNASGDTTDPSAYTYNYVVTTMDSQGISESPASAVATCTNNLFDNGAYNTISWTAVPGAPSGTLYNIYKDQGGLYGYIGQTSGTSIVDANIAADLSTTPPIYDTVFNDSGDYPGAVAYDEQRRCFAGSLNQPQNLWMTRSGTESDMSYSLPTRDDDRINIRVAARDANTIRHIVPLTYLLLLTSSAEWLVSALNGEALTSSSISVRPQSYVGASNVQPSVIGNTLVYVAARGGHVRELAYAWQANGFITNDLCLRSAHLFDTFDIADMAYAKAPQPILWFVSTNGELLGLTYVPEQQIGAWHRHDTINGLFESCTVVAEGDEDVLYVVVNRTLNGQTVRCVERMASRMYSNPADAFYVDCGATYTNEEPVTTISGLTWLEGQTVSILADGAVMPQQVVTDGAITLQQPASVVQVGLPITADLETLPVAAGVDTALGQGRAKNVNKIWIRVFQSSGVFAGPDVDHLTEVKQRTTEPFGSPPALSSTEIPLILTGSWTESGQVFIRQSDPLPLTVVNLTAEVAYGA